MPGFEQLKYTKSQAKRAGKLFISNATEEERDASLEIINNWRAAHSFPMQIIYVHLRHITKYCNCGTSDEDVVLVSTASFNVLKQAYPNYFVDIKEFLSLIDSFLSL